MAKARILIVEDEKLLNEAYELVLKREGYEIHSVFNGEEALAIFDKVKPDLVPLPPKAMSDSHLPSPLASRRITDVFAWASVE